LGRQAKKLRRERGSKVVNSKSQTNKIARRVMLEQMNRRTSA